jgi:hypothetical protein
MAAMPAKLANENVSKAGLGILTVDFESSLVGFLGRRFMRLTPWRL